MSGRKLVRILLPIIFLLAIPVLIPWVAWLLKEERVLEVAVLDKTVPTEEYREHLGLFWVLKHWKVKTREGLPYDRSTDYMGFRPDEGSGDDSITLPQEPDLIYIADTYGVYQKDMEGNPFGEHSELLYGGLSFFDWNKVMEAKREDTTLIVEFNSIASPTPPLVRKLVEETVGISWSGWVGRYFNDLDDAEVPVWLIDSYEKQAKETWAFKGEGLTFVHESGSVLVLDHEEVKGPVEFTWKNPVHGARNTEYGYWFDVITSDVDANIQASYRIPLNEKGKKMMKKVGIPLEFPAVIHQRAAKTYYFAGDFADISKDHMAKWSLPRTFYYIMGWVLEEERFFWDSYIPLMEKILNEIESDAKVGW